MKPTLKDVAKEAGVSTATVSMVLAGKGKISEEVSNQVFRAAERLGYTRPSTRAHKRRDGIKYVGVIAYCGFRYQWNFIEPFITNIQAYLLARKFVPVLLYADKKTSGEELFDTVLASGASSVIVIHLNDGLLFKRFQMNGIQVILLNNSSFQSEFHTVCVDDFQGAYEGAQHLIMQGHRNILYLEYARPDQPSVVADRFIGFQKAMEEAGLEIPRENRLTFDLEEPHRIVPILRQRLAAGPEITALFVHDDYFASRLLPILGDMGKRVPEDISIIAPGDVLPYDEPFCPQITTMRINTGSMGELAARLVVTNLERAPSDIQVIKIKEQLVERGSCRSLKVPANSSL